MKLETKIEGLDNVRTISGINNSNIKVLEEIYSISIDIYGDAILCDSNNENIICELNSIFKLLIAMREKGIKISTRDVYYIHQIVLDHNENKYLEFIDNRKPLCHTFTNKPIFAKTLRQNDYIECLRKKDLIFSIGSAGTGKTYLAVCYAVGELKKGNVEKIILTRPAVEAGESLGFLPGDLKEKVDPYLRPLYDALYDMLGIEQVETLIEKQVIEIAPLAYMRGRTLENAVIILDEAQNATIDQLKMFLTRMGFNSKMIVTGDISQVDLPQSKKSGLKISAELLKDLKEVGYIVFDSCDVVRHPLVGKIIERFESLKN